MLCSLWKNPRGNIRYQIQELKYLWQISGSALQGSLLYPLPNEWIHRRTVLLRVIKIIVHCLHSKPTDDISIHLTKIQTVLKNLEWMCISIVFRMCRASRYSRIPNSRTEYLSHFYSINNQWAGVVWLSPSIN